jgi:YD repeat-containing protein
MTLTYNRDQGQGYLGQIYLQSIQYAGNNQVSPSNEVKFYLESRTDIPDLYTLNFRVRTTHRLRAIEILSNGNHMRAYQLTYKPGGSTTTFRSLLESVQQFGKDESVDASGNVTGTSLPKMIFGWQAGGVGFASPDIDTAGAIDPGNAFGRQWADVNGDGKLDFCRIVGTSPNTTLRCTLSAGTGFGQEINSSTTLSAGNPGQTWVDVNGDGKADFCRVVGSGPFTNLICAISTGADFAAAQISTTAFVDVGGGGAWVDFNGDGKADFCRVIGTGPFNLRCTLTNSAGTGFDATEITSADIDKGLSGLWVDANGDGKADFCRFIGTNPGPFNLRCTLSTGTGFAAQEIGTSAPINVGNPLRRGWADVNGDGKLDLCRVVGTAAPFTLRCTLSTGTGFAAQEIVSSAGIDPGFLTNDNVQAWVDVNGDGKADFCRPIDAGSTSSTTVNSAFLRCTFSTGTGFAAAEVTTPAPVDLGFPGTFQSWVDFNGDGKLDFCRLRPINGAPFFLRCTLGAPPIADLLASVSNGLGGSNTIAYAPSTQGSHPQLPFPVQTLSSVTNNDGNGNVFTTNYAYEGGYYHPAQREFRGFNHVTVTGPAGPDGQIISETWFHQGDDIAIDANNPNVTVGFMKGKPYRVRVTDGAGREFSKTEITYATITTNPYFNPPFQVDTWTCEGSPCNNGKQTRIKMSYDSFGNPTREESYGDINVNTLDRTVVRAFSSNTGPWIVGLPITETILNRTGAQVAFTSSFYDGVTSCSAASNNTIPDKGNLTRVVRWLQGGTDVDTRTAYNAFGNPVCTRDANGNTSTLSYDSSGIFPTIVTNPLNQQIKTEYYGVDSALLLSDPGLYGQVKRVIDPSNNVTTTQYDLFARKIRVDNPDGSWTRLFYNNFGGGMNVQHIQTDTAAGLSSWRYFDGLGRTILEKKTGPAGKIIVTRQEYNVTGAVKRSSLPYFESIDAPKWKQFFYDPMGRVTQTINPDQSTASVLYGLLVVTGIDASGHQKRETRDVYGRLKMVEEFTGVSPSTTLYAATNYKYDVLGNLISVTDAQQNKTTMRYDTLGRKIAMSDPDMGSCGDLTALAPNPSFPWYPAPCWNYLYDPNGNLLKQIDAQGTTLEFTYDSLNRVKTKAFIDRTAPSAPSGLSATMISASRIDLLWSASSDNAGVKEYRIERCFNRLGTPACSNFIQITSVTTTTYSNTPLQDGNNYSYRIRAMDTSGNLGGYSNTATATLPDVTPPSIPNLTVTVFSSNRIDLSWPASTDNVGVTGYEISRCQGAGCTPTVLTTLTGTSYNDTQRTANTSYTYKVRARDAVPNWSNYSTSITKSTPVVPADTVLPTVPSAFVATAVSTAQVNLSWSPSTDNLLQAYYEVERSPNKTTAYSVIGAPAGTSFTDITASAGVTYLYRVRAVDGAGNKSAYSTIDLATTIMFTDDPLVAGVTPIKSAHFIELRQAVNAVRVAAGLVAATWTDATLTGVSIKTVHIQELRNNLGQARSSLGVPALIYTDPTLTPLVTVRKSAHVQELRQGVK